MSAALSLRLAEWLAALEAKDVPAPQRELARLRLMDTVGLLFAAGASPQARILREHAAQSSAAGGASMVGAARPVRAEWAALANGVVAHSLDFDDTLPDSVVHPGSVVVPVALALAEELQVPAGELIAALAGGYEVAARLASAGGTRFHARGFHASGIFAPLAAAFTAARLMRLPPERMASAAGLAASMAGGLMAFQADGAWSKWLHLGWGAHGGIAAARLAGAGFRGPAGALDGRANLYAAFLSGTSVELGAVDAGLGAEWHGDAARFKYYPCAHVIQPYVDIALALKRAHAIAGAAVASATCRVAPWAVAIVCEPAEAKVQPASPVEAIASLRFNLALALVDGRLGLEALEPATWRRAEVVALSRRVGYAVDPALAGFAAGLEIEMADGRRLAAAGDASAPDPARLAEKFRAAAARRLPAAAIAPLERAISGFAAGEIGAALRRASD